MFVYMPGIRWTDKTTGLFISSNNFADSLSTSIRIQPRPATVFRFSVCLTSRCTTIRLFIIHSANEGRRSHENKTFIASGSKS